MQKIHTKLTQKYQAYNNWHNYQHHNKIHWGVLVGWTLVVFYLLQSPLLVIAADATAPTTPTNLTATVISSSQIDLSWTASTDDVGVTGYKIYRCAGTGCAPTVQIATSAINSYPNTGLTASTAYTYAVSAYDAAGNESGRSISVSGTTLAQAQTILEIPITIEEPAGIARTSEPITSGIPLPQGTQITNWSLWDGNTEIPLQTTKLQGRTPWILLDFQTSVPINGKKTLTLKDTAATAFSSKPINITEDASQITIDNKIIKTKLSKTNFNLFEEVWIDKDNDGTYSQAEQIIIPQQDNIQIVDSTTGTTFSGKGVPDKILWEYQGPIRSTLRVDGRYRNGSGEFIAYTTRLTFYAGRSDVKIEHILRNSYQLNERHVKIKSATVKIGSGTASVRATRPGSISWANVDTGGTGFDLVPAMLWDIDTATNNGMVIPDWSYHGATIIADFAERLTIAEQTNRTNASKAPLFAIAPGSWYSEYGELSTSKFSTLEDEKQAYQKWGWTWTASDEPVDQLATGPGKTIPDYAVSWRDVSVHGDTESDDLWQHNLMYLRTGQRSYWDRAVAWARYQKWEYAFRTDGFNYAWNSPFEQAAARVNRPAISIPLSITDQLYLNGIYDVRNGGRVDVLDWGSDHFWGWGLIDYYYLTGDQDALEAVGDLAEVSQRVLGWQQPGSYNVSTYGFRQEARHLLLLTRLYEATQDPKWKILMDTIAQLFLQSSDWDSRGMYGISGISPLHIGFLSHALLRYYQVTGNTLARDRLIAIAEWIKQYALHSTYLYSGKAINMDDPNPGDIWHSYFDDGNIALFDPAYTTTVTDTLVIGYRLTGDISFLERAKYHWDRGSKGAYQNVSARSAGDNEVGRFMNNGFLHGGIRRYYAPSMGDLSYAHLLFYDYTHLGSSSDTTAPTAPTNLTANALSSSEINLSWTASTDDIAVTGYRIYRNGIQIATTTTTSYSDTGLLPSTSYSYSVAAIDGAGNTSAQSASVSATTLALSSNPIYNLQPGHWYEVPNSHLRDVAPCGGTVGGTCNDAKGDPTQACYNSYAIYDFSHIIGGWNGGAFDTKRDRLIIWGGGHRGWAGNDIYAFDLNTLKWTRVKNASCIKPEDLSSGDQMFENMGYYLDDTWQTGQPYKVDFQKPRARHTYNYIQYIPAIDRFCSLGGAAFSKSGQGPGSAHVDCFNFETLHWEQMADTSSYGIGAFSAVDPVTGHAWIRGNWTNANFSEFDPVNNTWTVRNSGESGRTMFEQTAAIDPVRRKFVAIGKNGPTASEGSVYSWNIGASGIITRQTLSTTGATEILNSMDPGFQYDPVSDRFVAWNGGANVYTLDMDTLVWTKHTPAPTNTVIPTAAVSTGTYGRFRYIPSKNAFVVVNSVDQNVYIYKLNTGGGIPTPTDTQPPSVPSNLAATAISSSQINLSWTASADDVGVAGYKIYRNGQFVNSLNSLIYNDTGLTASTAYTYAVSAYDAAGNESGKSTAVSATTLPQFKQADLNQDQKVNQQDFDILKQDWNRTDKPKSDLNQDGIVDSRDLGIMMGEWSK